MRCMGRISPDEIFSDEAVKKGGKGGKGCEGYTGHDVMP